MHGFACFIGIGCVHINRLVAKRAFEYCWIGTCHTTTPWNLGLWWAQPLLYYKKAIPKINKRMSEVLGLPRLPRRATGSDSQRWSVLSRFPVDRLTW
jgi:hypothetical protein